MIQFKSSSKNDVPRRRTSSDYVRPPAQIPTGTQFRRNQTMSGVRRPDSEPISKRTRVHSLTRRRHKISALFVLVVGVIIVLGGLISQFTAKVIVTGSSAPVSRSIDPAAYQQSIND